MAETRLLEDESESEVAVSIRMQRLNQILVNLLSWVANGLLVASVFAVAVFFLRKQVPTIAVDPVGRVYPVTIIEADRTTTQKK